jgi:hypothetical protein
MFLDTRLSCQNVRSGFGHYTFTIAGGQTGAHSLCSCPANRGSANDVTSYPTSECVATCGCCVDTTTTTTTSSSTTTLQSIAQFHMVGTWNDAQNMPNRMGHGQGNLVEHRAYGCDVPDYFPNNAYTWVSNDVTEDLYCDDKGWWYGQQLSTTSCAAAVQS